MPTEPEKPIEIKKYDHGTVWALSQALYEVLDTFPSNRSLEALDDDEMSGRRIMVSSRHPKISELRKWREVLETYGVHRERKRKPMR